MATNYRLMHLNELALHAKVIAEEHGFTKSTPGESIALMHSELSEALEDIRNNLPLTEIMSEKDGKPCGVPVELADTVVRILHFCGANGIDLAEALHRKMEYNRTRPFMHGKVM